MGQQFVAQRNIVMAWEQRGKITAYYYRSERKNGQVKKLYLGKGSAAHEAAQEVATQRANRDAGYRLISQEEMRTAAADQLAEQVEELSAILLEAVLLGTGFWRQNYGRWRKRREHEGIEDQGSPRDGRRA